MRILSNFLFERYIYVLLNDILPLAKTKPVSDERELWSSHDPPSSTGYIHNTQHITTFI